MNGRESAWLASGGVGGLLMLFPLLIVLLLTSASTADEERPPDRAPLLPLCAWFPYPKVTALVPKPAPPREQTIFYGEVQCGWATADGVTRLELSAARLRGDASGTEIEKAGEHYTSKLQVITDPEATGAGLGDESQVAVDREDDGTHVAVTVRDGVLVVQADFYDSRKRPMKPDLAVAKVKDAAAEILRLMPPDGR